MKSIIRNRLAPLAPLWGLLLAAGCKSPAPSLCTTNTDCPPPQVCDPVTRTCMPPVTRMDLSAADLSAADLAAAPDLSAAVDLAGADLYRQVPDLTPAPDAYVWAQRFGSTGTDTAFAVATDPGGNVILTGAFQGTVTFGTTSLTSAGSADIFVAKLASDGKPLWAHSYGGTGDDEAYGVAVDSAGNIAIAGTFQGTVNFAGHALTSAGGYDVLVAQLSPAGAVQWVQRHGGTQDDAASSVAVDQQGNVDLTGYFTGTALIGGVKLVSAGGADVFLTQLSGAGVTAWAHRYGGPNDDFANRVAADPSGNIVLCGQYSGTASFGGTGLTTTGQSDGFLARYSSSGAFSWSRGFASASIAVANGVAVDAGGNVVTVGSFLGKANFGGGTVSATGPDDVFVVHYGASGNYVWARHFGGVATISGGGVAIGIDSSVVITGASSDTIDFGTGPLLGGGVYAVRFAADGTLRWSRNYVSPDSASGLGVAIDGTESAYVAGSFATALALDGNQLSSAGDADAFLLKLAP